MNRRGTRRTVGMMALLLGFATLFWLTSVVMSSLPGSVAVAVNVHGLDLPGYGGSALRPAPLSLSLLNDAQQDQATNAPTPSSTPTAKPTRPVTPPAPPAPPTPAPAPSPTGSGLPIPPILPSPSAAPATITGQVVDSQTRVAIVGARIAASPGGGSTTTGINGDYSLGVNPGSYTVTASAPTYNSASQGVTVRSGQQLLLNFKLVSITAYGSLSGTVTDALTNAPIAGATVKLSNGLIRVTDINGNFSYAIVLNGTYTLTVAALGYLSQNQTVTIRAGKTTTVQIGLTR